MFKSFPLIPDYSFDLSGNCQIGGKEVYTAEDFLELEINGKKHKLSKKWLGLISHYELDLSWDNLLNVNFFSCNSKVINSQCGQTVLFKQPICFENGFFFIPGFTRFAINRDGVVISIKTGRVLKSGINSYGYYYVNIYDPDKNRWRSVATHILLAKTFISNKDPCSLFFVNHKNGNKKDIHLENLEWVSSAKNVIHAVENNLRKDNIPCKIRDIYSLAITEFKSVGACLKELGYVRTNSKIIKNLNGERIPHLFLGRFEIKYLDDNTEWFYTKENKDLVRYLNTGPYEAFNVVTHETFEGNSISELSEKISLSRDVISSALRQVKMKTYDNFLIRKKSSGCWPTEYKPSIFYPSRKFLLRNIVTDETISMKSLRKAIAFLGIDKRTFKLRLAKKQKYKNWEIIEKQLQ